ncbi:hypothetical protein T552_02181 [Pneumocystis carinii B80]|uniref:Uncharacterized protein n=1 Tax=Pneumocystis carinii (strain B80) TaxID=1408658 RepID=A0A0W4ZH87_PNEC8|nr:hypothetical protein T552_02181 [Pneumocystis carinii B80]KTW27742.1 hypothetical protein T552_02181 [Pneumocystis carinii B80]
MNEFSKKSYDTFNSFNDKLKLRGCKINNISKGTNDLSLKNIVIKKIVEFSDQLTVNILKTIPWDNIGQYLWKEIIDKGYDSLKIWKIFVEVYHNSIESPDVFNKKEIITSSFIPIFKEIDCDSLYWLSTLDINGNKSLTTENFIYISYLHNLIALNVSNTNLTDMILSHWGRAAQKDKFIQLLYIDIRNNQCTISCAVNCMAKFKSLLYFSIENNESETMEILYEKYPRLKPSYQLIEHISHCKTFEDSYRCIFNFHSHFAGHSIIYNLLIKSQDTVLIQQFPPLLFYSEPLKGISSSLNTTSTKRSSKIQKKSLKEKIYKRNKSKQIENWEDIIE